MMRLQKYLAKAGIASRRASEQLIRDGRITLNGTPVTTPGQSVSEGVDVVTFDGTLVTLQTARRTILLYKPRGYICSASSAQGKTVLELVTDIEVRLFPVGRLDKDSEGLLLLTNDGELANQLTHPRYEQRKLYEVTVSGTVTEASLRILNRPMIIDAYEIQPAKVTILKTRRDSGRQVLLFELKEGRNRQIRKMCEAVELRIHRLVRTRLKDLTLGSLRPAQWRDLTEAEINDLQSSSTTKSQER